MTHASTRGGHAYLEGQARTPSHLQITSGDVGDALLSLSKYLCVVMDQPQMFSPSQASLLYQLLK